VHGPTSNVLIAKAAGADRLLGVTTRCTLPTWRSACFASARVLPRCALRRPVPHVNEGVHPRLDTAHPPLLATFRLPGLVGATGLHPFAAARSFSVAAFFCP